MNFILNTIFLISTIIRLISITPNPYSILPLDDIFSLIIFPTRGFLLALALKGNTIITIFEEIENKLHEPLLDGSNLNSETEKN